MAWQTADLDLVKAAIAQGASKVRYSDGREIFYRSVAELIRAKTEIEKELGIAAKSKTSFTGVTVVSYVDKGV
jgi:hypothetical protein